VPGRPFKLALRWVGVVSMLLLIACSSKRTAAQDQLYKPPYASAEYNDFLAADYERNPQTKIKLLDNFSGKYPNSKLVPKIYQDYYQLYFSMKDYGRAVEYADKFLALQDGTDLGDRLDALMTRAQGFLQGCGDAAFQTAEAYAMARSAAVQGLKAVSQFTIPGDGLGRDPEAKVLLEREHLEAVFYKEAEIAESGLKGRKDHSCSTKKIEIEDIRLFSGQVSRISRNERPASPALRPLQVNLRSERRAGPFVGRFLALDRRRVLCCSGNALLRNNESGSDRSEGELEYVCGNPRS
jgi:tetratricopeptide (TPR) repeat protein